MMFNSAGPKTGVAFDGAQRVGSLNRTVLARVAGQNYPTAVQFRELQKCQHLARTELPGFIDDHDRSGGHRPLL